MRDKILFFHNPRTAGISVARYTGRMIQSRFNCFRHMTVKEVRLQHPEIFHNSFKFMFCRNPYARFVSSFYYIRDFEITDPSTPELKFQLALQKILKQYGDFYTFKSHWNGISRRFNAQEHFRSQYLYAYDEEGKQIVDFIGRFEQLDDDYVKICQMIGIQIPGKLPHDNVLKTKHPDWKTLYKNKNDYLIVEENYKKDFELFGFQKLSETSR